MQRKKIIGVCLDQVILENIDQKRGLVKRSTYVNDLLKKLLCDNPAEPATKSSEGPTVSLASKN